MRALVTSSGGDCVKLRAVRKGLALAFAAPALFASQATVARAEHIILGTVGGLDKAFAPIFFARELGYLKQENLDVELINFAGTGVLFPQVAAGRVEVGFPTAEPPGMLVRLGRAIAKGTVACEANIPACYKAVWRNDPSTRPPNLTDAEAIHYALQVNYRRLNAMKTAKGHYAEFDRATWQTLVEALHDGGQLATTAIPLDSLYTNAFVKAINAFDYDAVVREAKARK
jgi:hypothetical protein